MSIHHALSLSLSNQTSDHPVHRSALQPPTDPRPRARFSAPFLQHYATTGYAVEGAAVLISEQMSTEVNPKFHAVSALCIIYEKTVLTAKTVGNWHVVEART